MFFVRSWLCQGFLVVLPRILTRIHSDSGDLTVAHSEKQYLLVAFYLQEVLGLQVQFELRVKNCGDFVIVPAV